MNNILLAFLVILNSMKKNSHLTYLISIFCFFLNPCIPASADNTFVTEQATCPILRPELQHTINLFWINKELDLNQNYIFPCKNEVELTNTYLKNIIAWANKNPHNTVIQIWYDGSLIPQFAVDNTQSLINQTISDSPLTAPIILRNLRSLPLVQNNPHILDTNLDVFFRADLLRLIVSLHDISVEGVSYSMYADLDMPPITYEEIYDQQTLKNLEYFGIVLTEDLSVSNFGFENNFHIISYHNPNILEAIQFVLIDLHVERARNLLHHHSYFLQDIYRMRQLIFRHYRHMFSYFYYLEGYYERLEIADKYWDGTGVPYNREEHGLRVFHLFGENELNNRDIDKPLLKFHWKKGKYLPDYPVKTINIPKARSQYIYTQGK